MRNKCCLLIFLVSQSLCAVDFTFFLIRGVGSNFLFRRVVEVSADNLDTLPKLFVTQ
jgi:hypothetical protein